MGTSATAPCPWPGESTRLAGLAAPRVVGGLRLRQVVLRDRRFRPSPRPAERLFRRERSRENDVAARDGSKRAGRTTKQRTSLTASSREFYSNGARKPQANFECTALGGFGRFAYLALLPKSPAPDRHPLEDQATDQTVTEHGDNEDRAHQGGVRGRGQEAGDARQPLLRRGLDGEDLRDQIEGGAHAEEGRRHAVRPEIVIGVVEQFHVQARKEKHAGQGSGQRKRDRHDQVWKQEDQAEHERDEHHGVAHEHVAEPPNVGAEAQGKLLDRPQYVRTVSYT